ncbi:MAG: CRTAC1 family protein [Acidobacteria bacterium]|nr:CRTAC1 family protein [Acidobacteriota bacterium]
MRAWVLLAASAALAFEGSSPAPVRFRNVARCAGVEFVLENTPTPEKQMIETMAGGLAVFDYNGDGRADIFFTNGAALPGLEKSGAKHFNRLYRNEGGMKFTDVTAEAGVAGAGYSMGAAAGDYDNDGHVDLFVAGVNRNTLYRNLGNGKFEDVTARSGIRGGVWAVAAGWLDYDNDGRLDLFVANYLQWSVENNRFCGDRALNLRMYCHPRYFEGLPNTLYRNRGDGTFADVSEKSGIARHIGKAMSLAFADYDRDGYLDVFVTNDKVPNFLFHNRRNGTFEEVALTAGVALADHGQPISSMGADFRDYDNDGQPDVSVVALAGETFPLFRNLGKGMFRDATYASGLGPLCVRRSGWSQGFFDFNNDGFKDLFVSGSHVNDVIERIEASRYKEANMLFLNRGDGRFIDGSDDFRGLAKAHRGTGFADFNGDGRMDVVVTVLGEPAELWENLSPGGNHWLVLKLTGTKSNRDGIGAEVRIGSQVNHMTTAVGYSSSSHDGVHFGLGKVEKVDQVEIRWPSGTVQVLRDVKAGQVVKVVE